MVWTEILMLLSRNQCRERPRHPSRGGTYSASKVVWVGALDLLALLSRKSSHYLSSLVLALTMKTSSTDYLVYQHARKCRRSWMCRL